MSRARETADGTRYVNASGDTITGTHSFGGFISLQTSDANGYPRINGSSSSAQLGLFRSAGGTVGGMYIGGDADQFSVWSDNFTRRLNVDQLGRVTMPYQPAFRGYVSPDQTVAGEMTSNWNIQYNRGNCFSGGRFTCPVSGVYAITVAIDASGSPSRIAIKTNNATTWAMTEPYATDQGWETIHISTDVYATANDFISLYADNGTGSYPYHMGGGYWGWFSVHLVG